MKIKRLTIERIYIF